MFKIFLVQELCSCSLATALDRAAFGDEDKVRAPPLLPLASIWYMRFTLAWRAAALCRARCWPCCSKWRAASRTCTAKASSMEVRRVKSTPWQTARDACCPAHSASWALHADLTPGNVLLKVDKDSKTVVVKLAVSMDHVTRASDAAVRMHLNPTRGVAPAQDFGLSQRLDAQATHVSNFNSGTPFYVAPEVRRGVPLPAVLCGAATTTLWRTRKHCPCSIAAQVVLSKRLSPASDVYSWAILAW